MNFNERYKRDNEKIVPDEKFLVGLTERLQNDEAMRASEKTDLSHNHTHRNNKTQKGFIADSDHSNTMNNLHNRKNIWIIGITAACLIIVISIFALGRSEIISNNTRDKQPLKIHGNKIEKPADDTIEEKTTQDTSESSNTDESDTLENIFENSSWYTKGEAPTKVYERFLERLKNDQDLKTIYMSHENVFSNENVMNENEFSTLIDKISSVTEYSGDIDQTGEEVFYMSEFRNGDIIKFTIVDDQYLIIKGIEIIYKIN